MFNKQPNPQPLGVPLDALEAALEPTTLQAARDGDTLVVHHEKLISRVEVIPPANPETGDLPISAVVRIKTNLPSEIKDLLARPEFIDIMNRRTALGAVTSDGGDFFIGSRLTIYEQEEAWNIQIPLLLFSVIGGVEAILGATRRIISEEEPEGGASEWTEEDMNMVETYLSKISYCNADKTGLTAEFGLKADAVSAMAGDHETALWQLFTDQPHPELGGGLFCLLQLPHQMQDEAKLDNVLAQLNQMEMEPHDLPPHFGAWCRGKMGNNPAYVSFLPNDLHSAAKGIAVNVSTWAFHRAQCADAMLATLGVR